MSSGQWEVVGRNKKDKANNQANKKPAKVDKKRAAPVPKVEDILPLSQVKSIYASMGKNNKENKRPAEKDARPKEPARKQAPRKPEKSAESAPKPKPPRNIESALNSINVDDFRASLAMSKQRFPDASLVWLKELAAVLNAKIALELNDPVFTTKPDAYPLSAVPTGVRQVLEQALQDAGRDSAQLFFDVTLTAMANDMSKGLAAVGHKICLQQLALSSPQLCTAHLDKHQALRTSYQNRQPIGLSVLWALGQGGVKDFHVGLKVFKDFMLPLLEMKNYTRYIVKYLSQLLSRHENAGLSRDNYLFLQEVIAAKHGIANDVAQELAGLAKKLKAMLFAKGADKRYTGFFELFLGKLTGSAGGGAAARNDHCDTLVLCLNRDPACYTAWRQSYAKQYQPSCVLLKYISDHWKKVSAQLDKKQFKELLTAFTAANTELLVRHKKDSGLQESARICKALLDKMTVTKSFPWKTLRFVLMLVSGALLAYDFHRHGSWNQTQSVRTLKELGVWAYGEKAWVQAHHGLNWTRQRIEEYAPGYLDATSEAVQPYVELGQDLAIIAYNVASRSTRKIQAKMPNLAEAIDTYAPGLLDQVHNSWQTVTTPVVEYWARGYKYVTTEVFVGQLAPENVQKVLAHTWDTTQKYALEYYNWMYEKVQTTVQGK